MAGAIGKGKEGPGETYTTTGTLAIATARRSAAARAGAARTHSGTRGFESFLVFFLFYCKEKGIQ